MGLWSTMKLILSERSTVLKSFILSRLVYWFSLMLVPKRLIVNLQKEIYGFFWNKNTHQYNFILVLIKNVMVGLP